MKTRLALIIACASLAAAALAQSASPTQSFSQKDATGYFKPPTGTLGWNVVSAGGTALGTSESIIDATQFVATSGDVCTQINQALLALPAFGGTVDARGLTGNLTCKSNPWASFAGGATLLLGAATYETTATWVIPNKSRMFGIGRADPNSLNTEIQWAAGAQAAPTPVIDFAAGFGIFVGNLGVDCMSSANLIGIRNQSAQEESGVDHSNIRNCLLNGLDVSGNNAQNSGPYSNLEVNYTGGCLSSTIPVNYTAPGTRGINGLTITADGCTHPSVIAAGVDVNGPSNSFEHVHCENVDDCIRIGNSALVHDIVVSDVVGCPDNMNNYSCTNVVHICGTTTTTCSGSGGATEVVVDAIAMNDGTGDILQDDVTQTTIPASDGSLGLYVLGHGTIPTLISTSSVGTSGFTSHLGTGNADTAGTCTLSAGSCTVPFTTAYSHTPVCVANSTGSKNALKVSPSTSSVAITSSSSTDTSVVGYICIGNPN